MGPLELRQYTLHAGQRDVLVELFDEHFVESQEELGATIVGQFRDLDRPDRFVWLRGFADMVGRHRALDAFYRGPVWREHSAAANATMVDVDDVLLLRPATATSGFGPLPPRPVPGADVPAATIEATVCSLAAPCDPALLTDELLPALARGGIDPLGVFVEEPAENTFPALPVRTGEHVVVIVHRLADGRPGATTPAATACAVLALAAEPVVLRLAPTPRSQLR